MKIDSRREQLRALLPNFFEIYPFSELSEIEQGQIEDRISLNIYHPGEVIYEEGELPSFVHCIVQGEVRILGPSVDNSPSLKVSGNISIGWEHLIRRVATGSVRAAGLEEDVITLSLSADDFERLMLAGLAQKIDQAGLLETYDLITRFIENIPINLGLPRYESIINYAVEHNLIAIYQWFPRTEKPENKLPSGYIWLLSGGAPTFLGIGAPVSNPAKIELSKPSSLPIRLLGISRSFVGHLLKTGRLSNNPGEDNDSDLNPVLKLVEGLLKVGDNPLERSANNKLSQKSFPVKLSRQNNLPENLIACFWMICEYLQIPYNPDILRRWLSTISEMPENKIFLYSQIGEALGLKTSPTKFLVSEGGMSRLKTPALVVLNGIPNIVYEMTEGEVILSSPVFGLLRLNVGEFIEQVEVSEVVSGSQLSHGLSFERQSQSPTKKFGWAWLLTYVNSYSSSLIQVLVASIFVQILGLANPLLTQQIIDKVIVNASASALPMFGVLLVFFSLIEAVLGVLRTYLLNSVSNRVDLTLGTEIIKHLLRLPLSFFQKHSVGDLASRISELENIRQFLTGTFLTVALDVLFSVIYILVMLLYSVPLTICTLVFIPVIIGLTALGSPILQKLIRKRADQNSKIQSYLIEILNGVFTVKSQSMEALVQANWRSQYLGYLGTGFRTIMAGTTFQSANSFVNNLSSLLVLWVGGGLVLNGQLTLGGLIAFRIISGYVTGPLIRLSTLWQKFQEASLSMELLGDVINTTPEFAKNEDVILPEITGRVEYKDVDFGFEFSGKLQLIGINLDIPAGSFVGLAGQTGSGKSTLLKLLPRLYTPTSGGIYIDSYAIDRTNLQSLRQQMGIVPQDPVLFDGTVRDNITLFADSDDQAVLDAAKIAEAHEFIMGLPHGYNTQVGEQGKNLSGGQRQRIAIARMVWQSPRLVILDEATSALDYETERRVVQNLVQRFRGRTIFFITHRLANLRSADQIIYLESGQIKEQGTHEELMSRQEAYFCLFSSQVGEGLV